MTDFDKVIDENNNHLTDMREALDNLVASVRTERTVLRYNSDDVEAQANPSEDALAFQDRLEKRYELLAEARDRLQDLVKFIETIKAV